MTVELLTTARIPVDEVKPGDRLVLPRGRRVTIERVEEEDGRFWVRWSRPAERGEPGHRRAGAETVNDEYDGRYLGSLQPLEAGALVEVEA